MRTFPQGRLPDNLDPEAIGFPFQQACVVFGVRELLNFVANRNIGRTAEEPYQVFDPRHPAPRPDTSGQWWDTKDRLTPSLLMGLRRGDLIAFGDPGRAGAPPEWIARREWLVLQGKVDIPNFFVGGNSTYWNVRVIQIDQVAEFEKPIADGANLPLVKRRVPASNNPRLPPKPRGPKPTKMDEMVGKMLDDLHSKKITPDQLSTQSQKVLTFTYGGKRTLTVQARQRALSEFVHDNSG